MKKALILFVSTLYFSSVFAQGLLKKVSSAVNNGSSTAAGQAVNSIISNGNSGSLSNEDIVNGLKEALQVGTENSAKRLSAVDGFFEDAAVKILMPEEAKEVASTLRKMGMGSLVDKAILSMNRAAEDAATGVGEIFINAIKEMTISDAVHILRGNDNAATEYLKSTTSKQLTDKMKPVIQVSLDKVQVTAYWKDVFTTYNRFSSKKVDTDLNQYVTDKALYGIFYQIALEEKKIRKDPAAQVTAILKKVFGSK